MNLVNLHCHSDHSTGDCLLTIPEYVDWIAQNPVKIGALTDHGTISGLPEFLWECEKKGVTPVAGCELYFQPPHEPDGSRKNRTHLTALALDATGFANLVRLITAAHQNLSGKRPVVTLEHIAQFKEGLFFMSGCMGGYPTKHANTNKGELPPKFDEFLDVVGRDNFALEVMLGGQADQEYIADLYTGTIGPKYKLRVLPTIDSHYVKQEDAPFHRVLVAILRNTMVDGLGDAYAEDGYYLPTQEEWSIRWDKYRAKLADPMDIVGGIKPYKIGNEGIRFPVAHKDVRDSLWRRCETRMKQLALKDERRQVYLERLRHEFAAIDNCRLAGYIYMVADMVKDAKEKGILVGFGRGSAAGSLICFLSGITRIDPLRYGLIFERFWNPGRAEARELPDGGELLVGHLPDIDIDIPASRREIVIQDLTAKYGELYGIITHSTFAARAALRDTCRVYGYSQGEIKMITEAVPEEFGRIFSLEQAYNMKPQLREFADQAPLVFESAKKIEGRRRHTGVHASGYGISAFKADGLIPIVTQSQAHSGATKTCYGYTFDVLEKLGWGKIDILGLRNLDVAQRTLERAGFTGW